MQGEGAHGQPRSAGRLSCGHGVLDQGVVSVSSSRGARISNVMGSTRLPRKGYSGVWPSHHRWEVLTRTQCGGDLNGHGVNRGHDGIARGVGARSNSVFPSQDRSLSGRGRGLFSGQCDVGRSLPVDFFCPLLDFFCLFWTSSASPGLLLPLLDFFCRCAREDVALPAVLGGSAALLLRRRWGLLVVAGSSWCRRNNQNKLSSPPSLPIGRPMDTRSYQRVCLWVTSPPLVPPPLAVTCHGLPVDAAPPLAVSCHDLKCRVHLPSSSPWLPSLPVGRYLEPWEKRPKPPYQRISQPCWEGRWWSEPKSLTDT